MNVFNEEDFSDRVLRVEIVADSLDSKSDSTASVVKRNDSNKKQKREDLEEKVKTLHISSAMLAAKSPFFFKLFRNGMKESQEKVMTLRINTSEEVALMDLLKFMYSNTLSATSAPELVGVLVIADKFEVSSCTSYCCELLKEKPMSLESALLYLELPSSVLECLLVKPLLDAAKKYVVTRYRNVIRPGESQEEAMALPLSAIEALLGSEDLNVQSEDDVYDFILLWGRTRYPKKKERRDVLTKLLGRFLHFPYLCMSKLEEIQESPEFDSKEVSKLILKSLYLNAGFPYGQRYHFPAATGHRCSLNRDYDYLPIKAVQFESRCVVYLNLTIEKCWNLVSKGQYTQPFLLGEYWFALYVEAEEDEGGDDYMGLFVEMWQDDGVGPCMFDYELVVMEESSKEFECVHKADNCTLTGGQRVGSEKLFEIPSSEWFDCDNNGYVIDRVVRIQAEFTIKDSLA